jgi:hypothetical protein
MRKIIIALSALAAIGLIAPIGSASAETTVIHKEGGRHMDRHHVKKVIIKHKEHRDRHVVVKHRY